MVGGKAIVATQTYRLASHDYMLKSGGDGLVMFKNDKEVTATPLLDNEVLIQYITKNLSGVISTAYAMAQGRITVVREPFADVADTAWYYDGVVYTYGNGVFSGTSATAFSPAATMTRGQLVAVLWRMAGSPEPTKTAAFTDVDSDAYYAKAVNWAAENGITSGKSATSFDPKTPISRQQFATFLYQYAKLMKYDTTQGSMAIREFSDYGQISSYAGEAMAWANAAGLIQGTSSGTAVSKINPTGTATRGQVAVILMRFANVKAPSAS